MSAEAAHGNTASVLEAFNSFSRRVNLVVAVDHSGRAGNGFFLAIFDQHPQVLTCPWMHYIYSYIETEFGDAAVLDSTLVHAFLTTRSYFRFIYLEPNELRKREITKFGGDPDAPLDREVVRKAFDEIFSSSPTISRHDAVLSMYFVLALGLKRSVEAVRLVLVADSISLRTESAYSSFSGCVLDRVIVDFPEARIVQLVRDPRAAFASTNHQFVNSSGNMYGLHWGNYWDSISRLIAGRFDWERVFVFGFLLVYFREAYVSVERAAKRYSAHVLRVRNEDLNLNFQSTMQQLCNWLGVVAVPSWTQPDYVPTMLGRPWTGTGAYNSTYQTKKYGPLRNDPDTVARQVTGPNQYVTRRWRSRLAPNEVLLIEWTLRDELAQYGYEFVQLDPSCPDASQLALQLAKPLRGELPTLRWILDGRHGNLGEVADRAFFAVTFLPFYIGARLQLWLWLRGLHRK